MRQILTGLESGGSMSLTWVQLEGMHRRLRVRRSRRVYYILSGTFTFQVEGATAVDVSADDVLLLEPGATYRFEGRGNYLVLNTPAFAPGDDEYKDEERAQRT